jgi:thiamine pyrophosphokinase
VELKTFPGETISLYGLSSKTKIFSQGLHYELQNVSLPFGVRESTSNIARQNLVRLKISDGVIFIIRDINLMIKHDLF